MRQTKANFSKTTLMGTLLILILVHTAYMYKIMRTLLKLFGTYRYIIVGALLIVYSTHRYYLVHVTGIYHYENITNII